MKKIVVVLYGPPGSGKSTQANLAAKHFGLFHFNTGDFLESIVYDPDRQHQAVIKRERKLFETGKLMTPSFVLREVQKEIMRIGSVRWGVVLSGSPRTMYEAERLIPVLEKVYGKKKIHIFQLNLSLDYCVKRNGTRRICSVCGNPFLAAYHVAKTPKGARCGICAGPLYKRSLDDPKIIKIRYQEYLDRTKPIVAFAEKRGYKVHDIDGRPAPYKVMAAINAHLKNA